MKINLYPVSFKDFLKIMNVGNYTIMYAILDDCIYLEMPIENQIFVTKKFLSSIAEEMQVNVNDDLYAQIRFFLRHYLKGKNYYQFHLTEEEKVQINNIKLYTKLAVKEANKDIDYDPDFVSMKEDDVNIYIYQLDKLIYRLEKN